MKLSFTMKSCQLYSNHIIILIDFPLKKKIFSRHYAALRYKILIKMLVSYLEIGVLEHSSSFSSIVPNII